MRGRCHSDKGTVTVEGTKLTWFHAGCGEEGEGEAENSVSEEMWAGGSQPADRTSAHRHLSSCVCECPVAAGTHCHTHTHVRTRVHTCTHVLAHSAPRGLTGLASGAGLQGKSLFLPSSSLQRHLLSWPTAFLCVQSRLPICDSAPPQKDLG